VTKVTAHKHCIVCGNAIEGTENFCDELCQSKYKSAQRRQQLFFVVFLGIIAAHHGSFAFQIHAGSMIQTQSLLVTLAIFASVMTVSSTSGSDYMRIDDVTMALDGDSALMKINYTLDSFTSLYVLALGCRYLEPHLLTIFPSYKKVLTVSADPNHAVLKVEGAGGYSNGYYLFNSMPLRSHVPKFTVVYPTGLFRTFYNVTSTPNVFAKALNMSDKATSGETVPVPDLR